MSEEDLEREAEAIADEAVAGYERILPPEVVAEMRRVIVYDLLASDVGRERLRRAMPDRVVERSGEVGDEDRDAKKKTGGSGA
jgi:hypothetical protein